MKKILFLTFFGYLLIRIHYEVFVKKIRKGFSRYLGIGITSKIDKKRQAILKKQLRNTTRRKTYITVPRRN